MVVVYIEAISLRHLVLITVNLTMNGSHLEHFLNVLNV